MVAELWIDSYAQIHACLWRFNGSMLSAVSVTLGELSPLWRHSGGTMATPPTWSPAHLNMSISAYSQSVKPQ
jgi:hypothetical protein